MHETAFSAGPQNDYVCILILGRGPMSMHAEAFPTKPHAITGPMNYACNCVCGQITLKSYMTPHFWQDPTMIMYAPFLWAGAQLVCMKMPFHPRPKSQ